MAAIDLNFSHIVLTPNERKYILCLRKILKDDDNITLTATDGNCLYKTSVKSEGWKKMWNNFSSASVDITDDAFVAKLPGNVEYTLTAVKGEKKSAEMFSLIMTLAEINEAKQKDRTKTPQSAVLGIPNILPGIKLQENRGKKLKGSSIASPSKKKRKVATGVIYD